jgi:uridine monophosphate synthetase
MKIDKGRQRLARELFAKGCIKFGDFELEHGSHAPIYVDLRSVVSYPALLKILGKSLGGLLNNQNFDVVAGLPYAGLPIALAASFASGWPMIYPRKEKKDYGTKKRVEGVYASGQIAVVVDDVITDGGAKLELIKPLLESGLIVHDVAVVVDRGQGGKENLAKQGYKLHSIFTLRELVEFYYKEKMIKGHEFRIAIKYLANIDLVKP